MRYSGQGWEIPVSLTRQQAAHPDAATYLKLFETSYQKLFGRSVEGMEAEITVWSVNAFTPSPPPIPVTTVEARNQAEPVATRRLFDTSLGRVVDAVEVPRAALSGGSYVSGPALITEDETTVVLPPGRLLVAQEDGCLDIRLSGDDGRKTAKAKELAHV
jgi:N-methylhydantoinase A